MGNILKNPDKWKNAKAYMEGSDYCPNRWLVARGIDITRLKEKPGCYVVYHCGELVYIGQSNSPRFRMAQHLSRARNEGNETPWGPFDDLFIKIKYPSKYGQEAMIEKRLIRRLKPRLNGYMKSNRRAYRQS